jgi:hypothetical protein
MAKTHLLTTWLAFQALTITFFTVTARAGLIEDIYYRTDDGKIVLAFGILVLSLIMVLVLFYYLRLSINKYALPALFAVEIIAFTCIAFIPWRWGLAMLGIEALAILVIRWKKEKIVGVKIK